MPFPLASVISSISPKLWTLIIAMLPISELRGAIPFALTEGGLTWQEAAAMAVIGNFIPVIPILLLLDRTSNWLMKYRIWNRFFTWLFNRTRRKGKIVERFEALGLALFVAIPLPVTGAWTGCVAAFIFRIPLRLAIPAIACGILISATVVTILTLGSLGVITYWGIG